jgi:hypothetical protein
MAVARKLTNESADAVAVKRAEQARKAAAYDDAVAVLEATLGPSWTIGCPTVAEALAEPHTLRVLLGVPHPEPAASPEYIAELRAAASDYAEAREAIAEVWPDAHDQSSLADGIRTMAARWVETKVDRDSTPTVIDDTTPGGVLALLDAAADALAHGQGEELLGEYVTDARDSVAQALGLALRNPNRFAQRAADWPRPKRGHGLDAQVESLARLDGSVLLARHHRLAASTDEIIANPSDSGWSEQRHLSALAAICLAIAAKLSAPTGGAF